MMTIDKTNMCSHLQKKLKLKNGLESHINLLHQNSRKQLGNNIYKNLYYTRNRFRN